MDKNSTKLNLLRLIYNELPMSHSRILKQHIAEDTALRSEFEMLKDAKNALPQVLFNPSDAVLNRILAYSRHAAVEPQF